MRLLVLFTAAVCACGQTLPPLVDMAKPRPDWLQGLVGTQIQLDAQGNFIIAGYYSQMGKVPSGLTTIGPIGPTSRPFAVFKVDAQLEHLLYGVVMGGATLGGESLGTVTVRPDGRIIVTGATGSPEFPVTSGAPMILGTTRTFFVVFAPDGTLEFSRVFPQEDLSINAVAVSSSGDIYIAGGAGLGELPTTPGVYTPDVPWYPFVARLNATSYEPELVVHFEGRPGAYSGNGMWGMALRPGGGVTVLTAAGLMGLDGSFSQLDFKSPVPSYDSYSFAAGGGVYTVSMVGNSNTIPQVQQFALDGRLLHAISLPSGPFLGRAVAGSDGTAYFPGTFNRAAAVTYNALEACGNNRPDGEPGPLQLGGGLTIIDPAGKLRYSSVSTADLGALLVVDDRYLYGIGSGFSRLDLQRIPTVKHVAPSCIANAASFAAGPSTPGELMSIFGSGLGPDVGESFQVVNGRSPMSLAGTSVTVDGRAVPILYAQDQQINFIVPWGLRTRGTAPICVTRGAETSCVTSFIKSADPGVFMSNGKPIVVRQDWSLVTATNRPVEGEVITMWLTGMGSMDSVPQDGEVSGLELRRLTAPLNVSAVFCNHGCTPSGPPWVVEYAGSAPGMLSGITQLNVRIPPGGLTPVTFLNNASSIQITVGDSPAIDVDF